jgi:hypothetical protein
MLDVSRVLIATSDFHRATEGGKQHNGIIDGPDLQA